MQSWFVFVCFKVPRSAYIDTFDFESPKALVEYLVYLSKNATAYNAYFAWKKHAVFLKELDKYWKQMPALCDMCIKLHLESFEGIKYKTIPNIASFFNKSHCIKSNFIKNKNSND